ncbi:MAG TPA: GPR1/FUN34/YaaH family transporter [Streptosporangiaceae bacterium]|nr:GPR1/FUN34/YaaH family transporter [Streptosporangiaceae bacterium]
MTTLDATGDDHVQTSVQPAAAVAAPLLGNPAALGLPSFIVGSVALGLVLVGMVPATAVGASLPIILAATAAGLFIATIWAAAIGQTAVASVFGIFAGFWFSYAVLVLGLVHAWFAITLGAVQSTQELFLTAWLVVIGMLTLATLRLPLAFTAVFVLIDAALVLLIISTAQTSAGAAKAAGYVVLVFAAVGVYLFFDVASQATGGKPFPLGKPILRG